MVSQIPTKYKHLKNFWKFFQILPYKDNFQKPLNIFPYVL